MTETYTPRGYFKRVVSLSTDLPVVDSLSPATWSSGNEILGEGLSGLTVLGSGFTPSSVVRIEGDDLTTTYISAGELLATVPAASLPTSGSYDIEVLTPGAGLSNSVALSVVGDSDFASVDSILHLDGADGSTTFTDVITKTWTANGNAQLDTAQRKWGSASLLLDGTGDFLTTPSIAALNLASGTPYTLEIWVRPAALGDTVIYKRSEGAENGGYELLIGGSGAVNWITANGGATTTTATANGLVSTGVWTHIAVTNDGSTVRRIFVNGTLAVTSAAVTSTTSTFQVKLGHAFGGSGREFNGHLDDLRITNGVCRYTASFTVPSYPVPSTA